MLAHVHNEERKRTINVGLDVGAGVKRGYIISPLLLTVVIDCDTKIV